MIKTLIVLIFSLIFANVLFSQNYKTVQFVDIVHNKPVYGVMVFTDGDFTSVSNENGNCLIDAKANEIYCKYLGYKDTLVNIKDCNQCVIKLATNYNLLTEVEVDAKYDAKKHLINLLNESQQTAYELDTVTYYKFEEINTIPELEQTEIFTGILRVDNKGYTIPVAFAYISEISNYYNTIEPDNYELMGKSNVVAMLNSDVLFPRMIKRIKKKNNIERLDLYSKDSISFLVLVEKNKVDIEFSYINFENNKITTRAFAGTNRKSPKERKYYFKMDYDLLPISLPKSVIWNLEYVLENNLIVHNSVVLKKIDNPDIETELNVLLCNLRCEEYIRRAKFHFPNIVIPAELIEN
jgi:hypothetical protein